MSVTRSPSPSHARTKLYLDILLFGAFAVANLPRLTGVQVHEWISVFFIVPIVVHLVLDWPWITSVTRRLFQRLPAEVRFNHLLDLLSYILMVTVLFSGLAVSRAVLPALGIDLAIDRFWVPMHRLAADALMVMIGLHLVMHARWIGSAFRRYLVRSTGAEQPTAAPRTGAA